MLIYTDASWPRVLRVASSVALALLIVISWSLGAQAKVSRTPPPLAAQANDDRGALALVDHSLFDTLLRHHVVNGLVDYEAFAKAPAFAQYLAALDNVRPERLDDDERLAYWINVYNAYTIQLIVAHRETESIRNINKTLGALRLKGPWSEPLVRAAGRRLSLDDVQHGILRKDFGEPRVHFALVCAAMGCPPLRSEAYSGARLVEQLNDQAKRFLHDAPAKNRMERRTLYLSPILTAYRADFGPAPEDLGRQLAPWFAAADSAQMMARRFRVVETAFDWTLNSQAKGKATRVP